MSTCSTGGSDRCGSQTNKSKGQLQSSEWRLLEKQKNNNDSFYIGLYVNIHMWIIGRHTVSVTLLWGLPLVNPLGTHYVPNLGHTEDTIHITSYVWWCRYHSYFPRPNSITKPLKRRMWPRINRNVSRVTYNPCNGDYQIKKLKVNVTMPVSDGTEDVSFKLHGMMHGHDPDSKTW